MKKSLIISSIVLVMSAVTIAAEVCIDDFSVGDFHLGRDAAAYGLDPLDYPTWIPVAVPGIGIVETDDLGILGGRRTTSLERVAGSPYSPTVDTSTWLGGAITFNSGFDYGVATWSLVYGLQGDLNADFTACGNDRIRVEGAGQFETDLSGDGTDATPLTVTVISSTGSASIDMECFGNPDQSATYFDFMLYDFIGADVSDVDQLILTFEYSALNVAVDYGISRILLPSGCDQTVDANDVPEDFALEQNYPNPFNPTTTIEFTLDQTSMVNLTVMDISGRTVSELVNGLVSSGVHNVNFDAAHLSSGVYFYTLQANGISSTKKMVLLK